MNMSEQFYKLLNIHSVSGDEKSIRDYLKPLLHELMDDVEIDSYGNLLASKRFGSDEVCVLLSAHMDTVRTVRDDKRILNKSGIFTAELPNGSRGVLGADDRAGIAIILNILKHPPYGFNGVLKVAFTVEEETGCDGAEHIADEFLDDVDLAIVVDRRGSRDIVVGYYRAFCSDAVGKYFESVSEVIGMDYKCVEGQLSDAHVFSRRGINSVNLSAGYYKEHTPNEFASIYNMKDTVKLIRIALDLINHNCDYFGDVPKENKWVKNNFENLV